MNNFYNIILKMVYKDIGWSDTPSIEWSSREVKYDSVREG